MTAPFPPPDATREQIAAWQNEQTCEHNARVRTVEAAIVKAGGCPSCQHDPKIHDVAGCRASGCKCKRMHCCSSCGQRSGHRRGDRACPNYSTPARWSGDGKVWERP